MTEDRDHYEAHYAGKLWNLIPAVYRSMDTDQFTSFGPLREMVNRIGAQAAILRRSIDRLGQDQSIETCDDWVIPYIGDLLSTNLVASLDTAGQRRDVAKTIYYRRRKGTVAILEEIATDMTGWDAKVVEFFRRMARTRHGLDPALGLVQKPGDATDLLRQAEGLTGRLTGTPIGGTARLNNVYGATKTQTAFDEFFHTADLRYGQGQIGWQSIPHLGVFLWRLVSFETGPVTPVAVSGCPGWFTFDPTGRDIPLFARRSRDSDYYASQWVTPTEAQLSTPISQALYDAETASPLLYPESLAAYATATPFSTADALAPALLLVRPERGRLQLTGTTSAPVWLNYCYGFSDLTGAGPYDRRQVRNAPSQPAPAVSASGGVTPTLPTAGTLTINDSLTYDSPGDVVLTGDLTLMAANEQRPLMRFEPGSSWTEWTITGVPDSNLVLDGLLVSGADLVLSGSFATVTISCCTLDPGSAADGGGFVVSADERNLVPCRIWIEGTIGTLTIQRSVTGPVRTRDAGLVDTLCITDSILQGIATGGAGPLVAGDLKDPSRLQRVLLEAGDPVSQSLGTFASVKSWLQGLPSGAPATLPPPLTPTELTALLAALNPVLAGPSWYEPAIFERVVLSDQTRQLRKAAITQPALIPAFNRSLLEDAYPVELVDAALALRDGLASLSRCTVLGRLNVHRLEASECILNDLAIVDDTQHGCVRFTDWTARSVLPRQYESVRTAATAPIFTSTDFGQPGYAQLLPTADAQIQSPAATTAVAPPSILSGAQNGSEMGAFCLAQNSIKERALLIKYAEYMPAGLIPVPIYVT